MRTDGVQLAQEIVDGARAFVRQQYGDEYLPEQPRIYKCVPVHRPNNMLPQEGCLHGCDLLGSVTTAVCSTLRESIRHPQHAFRSRAWSECSGGFTRDCGTAVDMPW
jgi:hypothetical protein